MPQRCKPFGFEQSVDTFPKYSVLYCRFTPSTVCFLFCAVPNVYLLEIKLLSDRLGGTIFPVRLNQTFISARPNKRSDQAYEDISEQLNVCRSDNKFMFCCLS